MNVTKVCKRKDVPLPVVIDTSIEQFEDIKAKLIALSSGILILPEGEDTIRIDKDTSEVENWNDIIRFRRAIGIIMNTIRDNKLTNLSWSIIEERRVIWITLLKQ